MRLMSKIKHRIIPLFILSVLAAAGIVTSLVAIYIIWTFEVSEDNAYDIRKQLEAKRGKA